MPFLSKLSLLTCDSTDIKSSTLPTKVFCRCSLIKGPSSLVAQHSLDPGSGQHTGEVTMHRNGTICTFQFPRPSPFHSLVFLCSVSILGKFLVLHTLLLLFDLHRSGFNGNTDAELCSRWMQLSAFFPFYRNHNVLTADSQEPYRWASVASATRTAMHIRYSLLPYMYTLFHEAHTTGSTVMRALAWEFPNEPQLAGVDTQFLLGPNILVTPVLEPQVDTVKGVFPGVVDGEVWYDWYTGGKVEAQAGVNTTISAPLGHIPVFVRGGSILPLQEPGYTTTESRNNPWGLIVALSDDGEACGSLYVDDGESLEPSATLYVEFSVKDCMLRAEVKGNYADTNAIANVTVMGVFDRVGEVMMNEQAVDEGNVDYDQDSGVLKLVRLNDLTRGGAWKQGWTISW